MERDNDLFTLQVRLADKFGDLGMIGVVICRPAQSEAAAWDIDTWLMSCRVLGRGVEQAMLAKVVNEAQKRRVTRLIGTYIPTAKNGMVADHYKKLGFAHIATGDGQTRWSLETVSFSAPKLSMRVDDRMSALLPAAE
jgi:FkbH-like protein